MSTQISLQHLFGKCSHITFKNSYNQFKRILSSRGYTFNGVQKASFTEATFASYGEIAEWIAGVNLITDDFKETKLTATPLRNYQQTTAGIFLQNNWKATTFFSLETGVRADAVTNYGLVILPRLAALLKFSPALSSRIGGGMGYKAPTIFTEESERLQYKDVLPMNNQTNTLEKSYGVNADINYKTKIADGAISFSINHLFFYTRVNSPLLLQPDGSNYRFINSAGHLDSRGIETNVKLGYNNFKLFVGYTYTNAELHLATGKTENFLTPRHRLNNVLLYEVEEKWKLGLEGYYFSKQQLSDGKTGKPYWIIGFMAEKLWEKFSLYINFENFTDSRQTRFDTIYSGSITNPQFRDIYAPLDGFVVNGGIKLRL